MAGATFARDLDALNLLWGLSRFPTTAGLFDRSVSPTVDMAETVDDCTIWVEVPGLDKKDLDLSIAANVLTLKGEKKSPPKAKENSNVYRDELWSGSFQRSLSLPETVDPEKVNAEFRDGILKITIAKKLESKPRQIPVAVR